VNAVIFVRVYVPNQCPETAFCGRIVVPALDYDGRATWSGVAFSVWVQ